MDLIQLDKAFLSYERKLRVQERLRRLLGVKEVARPTYERYITGAIERFDREKTGFMTLNHDNPFGAEFRQRFKARTGDDSLAPLPYTELLPEHRIGQSLKSAIRRLSREYCPEPLPVTLAEARVEVTDKSWMTRLVKKTGLFFGAEMVRITRIDPRWIYSNVDISHQYAILVVVTHDRAFSGTSPSHLSGATVTDTYSRLKFITTRLADFIRGLGYEANSSDVTGSNTELLLVPMAIDAGIGEYSRSGIVLSPEFGPNMRIQPVTTDLPLEVDKPVSFGVEEFCLVCEECALYCPAQAIPFGSSTGVPPGEHNNPGYLKWYLNAERCLTFWAANKKRWTDCGGRCFVVCPWNKPVVPFHNMVRWAAIHSPSVVKKMLVQGDKMVNGRTNKIKD